MIRDAQFATRAMAQFAFRLVPESKLRARCEVGPRLRASTSAQLAAGIPVTPPQSQSPHV